MNDNQSILRYTFHSSAFRDKRALVELKEKKGLRISLAFPTLNEEATIAKEILVLKTELMDRFPLLDEIVVIDSGSKDRTREIAAQFGAKVHVSAEVLDRYGTFRGKGENLWKSLYVLGGDIIVWIDADIVNIDPKFLYGLVGPLLEHDQIGYVKAFYKRPIRSSTGLTAGGGGRVTEILVRPLFSLLYPELAQLVQPLSGEYAGRREILEQLSFSVGYGVEVGHLIDIYHKFGPGILAQVDMDLRIHRNQSIEALSRMSFGILSTFIDRLERYGETKILKELGKQHIALADEDGENKLVLSDIPTTERPPMLTIDEYMKKFYQRRADKPTIPEKR
ncbi:MAG TPA: glucosyl-3-phosphoglycerate synthase [Rectinemataceae bacterium]|nr:glucosyl-3-phosphoglycerate synthase [Rectinemataceae bacterium]